MLNLRTLPTRSEKGMRWFTRREEKLFCFKIGKIGESKGTEATGGGCFTFLAERNWFEQETYIIKNVYLLYCI